MRNVYSIVKSRSKVSNWHDSLCQNQALSMGLQLLMPDVEQLATTFYGFSIGFRAKGLVTHYDVELLQPFSPDSGIHATNLKNIAFHS